MSKLFYLLLLISLLACNASPDENLFVLLSPSNTGIEFTNEVRNKENFNIFNYRNFYNGAGVALGDINNDGLVDVFFTANMGANKLFLNKGNWTFEDISQKAKIEEKDKWSTGVVMVDINHDGLLDIYVCNAGYNKEVGQENALFINNGDLTFTESAQTYGLADEGYTTHAGFFDYDLDGDLDVYLLNNSFIPVNTLNYSNKRELRAADWPVKDFLKGGGDKLLRNDNGQFTDISEEAGIYGSLIGFGLGVTIGDVNGDLYPDIYVSNDFFERDYLYINQQNGRFSEELEKRIKHLSLSSMGADMADINNDGYPEIFVTDMLPDEEYRLKTTASFEKINVYQLKQEKGFYHQYMHNTLQLNDGNERFQEIAYYSGVAASDWSWGALIFDADNDSYNDIYVCNGIYHDVINQDFIDFFANDIMQKMALTGKKEQVDSVINKMPSVPISNKAFKNNGQLQFSDVSTKWGLDSPTFSNGAAYGDLDNDGDLDLVINNVNQAAMVYQNQSNQIQDHHYLAVQLKGSSLNTFAIGAKVELFIKDQIINRQLVPTRGFQSSIDYKLIFGLGTHLTIDSMKITWPDKTLHRLVKPPIDTLLNFSYAEGQKMESTIVNKPQTAFFEAISDTIFEKHQEDNYLDFYYERNIPVKTSQEGPQAAVGDVNGDGLEDIYIAGAANQAGQLYLQTPNGFQKKEQKMFNTYARFEDTATLFFDADGDGDLDLFVGSGGNHMPYTAREMQDRLYLNDGTGNFKIVNAFPRNGMNTSVAAANDFDQDGDLDLFVGSRSFPVNYGSTPPSYMYQNDGKGKFTNINKEQNKSLVGAGLVTDALWVDMFGDEQKELVLVGEWMAPKIYRYNKGKFEKIKSSLNDYEGWWYTLAANDVDGDGDQDLFLGNLGENFYLKASADTPLKLWMNDFDDNGAKEKIITRTIHGKDIPVALKGDMAEQVVSIKRQSLTHELYANKTIQDLFDAQKLKEAQVKHANFFSSVVAINEGDAKFTVRILPKEVQLSCVNTAIFKDLNQDQHADLIVAGNNYDFLPQFSRLDATFGQVLINDGTGNYQLTNPQTSGFLLDGEVMEILELNIGQGNYLLSLINNQRPVLHQFKNK